jgi:N-acetylglucosaminyldiphosphoundecaprenol N-acetyl-beta-D-mannosaminyltransferase
MFVETSRNQHISVLGTPVAISSLGDASSTVLQLVAQQQGGYVCLANVHMCMEAIDEPQFALVLQQAALVVADGRPILWAQRLLGFKKAQQVRGQDLMNQLCVTAAHKKLNIGLYGGASDLVLTKVKAQLRRANPTLQISYAFSPPYKKLTDEEMAEIATDINAAQVDILFVGIGCPKQELWMAAQKGKIKCVMLGVGAAFDFISGSKSHAPKWMQYAGLEWLFRLCSEPGRLWKRYLMQNPRFIFFFLKQLLSGAK